jgi:dipeptidase E
MKKIFLASSINFTAGAIAKEIGKDVKKLKTAFINTAAEPKREKRDISWLDEDRKGLSDAGFNLFDYTITGKTQKDIEKDLSGCDVIHVNGGNTFYLLLQAKKSGFDKFIRKFVEKGGIYIGSSAGSIIASPNIAVTRHLDTKQYEEELSKLNSTESFGLVDFLIFPHWGSEHFKDRYLNHRLEIAYNNDNRIILLTDYQYVSVSGETYKIVDIRAQWYSACLESRFPQGYPGSIPGVGVFVLRGVSALSEF